MRMHSLMTQKQPLGNQADEASLTKNSGESHLQRQCFVKTRLYLKIQGGSTLKCQTDAKNPKNLANLEATGQPAKFSQQKLTGAGNIVISKGNENFIIQPLSPS